MWYFLEYVDNADDLDIMFVNSMNTRSLIIASPNKLYFTHKLYFKLRRASMEALFKKTPWARM